MQIWFIDSLHNEIYLVWFYKIYDDSIKLISYTSSDKNNNVEVLSSNTQPDTVPDYQSPDSPRLGHDSCQLNNEGEFVHKNTMLGFNKHIRHVRTT